MLCIFLGIVSTFSTTTQMASPCPYTTTTLTKFSAATKDATQRVSCHNPFPLFQEERAHINSQMNSTIVTYGQCLKAVGIISSLEATSLNLTTGTGSSQPSGRVRPSLESNLTNAVWANSSDEKWSTCASLKTFVRCQKFPMKKLETNFIFVNSRQELHACNTHLP